MHITKAKPEIVINTFDGTYLDKYYNEEDDESIFTDNSFEKKGFICTDLWWTTGIDLEYYYILLEKVFGKDMRNDEEVKFTLESGVILNITPGTYRCTSFYDICNRDSNEPQIFIIRF